VKAVSGAISERAMTEFFMTVYESKGAAWADESIRHLWKQFWGLFLTRQRVSFLWLCRSQQGLWGLTNPFVTSEKSFEGYLWVGSDSVFLDCLWVTKGCLGCRILSPPGKAVSGAISEWAVSQFSLTLYESTGVMWADESIHHLWKQFQGRFLRGQRLSFSWLFMSQKGLCGLTNPFVTCEKSFGGYFWLGTESVFFDYLWVNRGCRGWRFHSSPVKRVSTATS
jgi:hypothetical protein